MTDLITGLALVIVVPFLIGLLLGIDRILTARMQNRFGPPLLQPFYDLRKLFGKERRAVNQAQVSYAAASLVLQMAAFVVFAFGGDLLVAFFVSGAGNLALALGAFSSRSAYGQLGGQRELLQLLAYEPVLFLVIFILGWHNGSFLADSFGGDLLLVLSLTLIAMLPVVIITMQKSPFDIATAHQEIISGVYVEYSGTYLGLLKIAHWFELAFVFGVITLFFSSDDIVISLLGKALLVLVFLFAAVLIDNSTARTTRGGMVSKVLTFGLALTIINLTVLWIDVSGVFW
ncbi:MAG: complex I subunit 1 family protein [Methanomassiliicoccales archaeon]